MHILYGNNPANFILANIQEKIKNSIKCPSFAIIQVGNNVYSSIYIQKKIETSLKIGIKAFHYTFLENISYLELKNFITKLNEDNSINGIIIQLPIPIHLKNIENEINYNKDIDGLTFLQKANLYSNYDSLHSCTAIGVIYLLKYYNITIQSQKIAVIGRSDLVGKPLAMLLLKENAMVSIFHSQLKENILKDYLKNYDIICSAVGCPNLIKAQDINESAILINIGCKKVEKKIVGDFEQDCYEKVKAYSPAINGVGPMTVACLMNNVYKAFCLQNNLMFEEIIFPQKADYI